MRAPPEPPRPDLVRQPVSGFGWLDGRLLREGWLRQIGPDGVAVLSFLALAADRNGVSFYSRDRMAIELDLDLSRLDRALDALLDARLVAHRPWPRRRRDGVWQLLDVPATVPPVHRGTVTSARSLLDELGLNPGNPRNRDR